MNSDDTLLLKYAMLQQLKEIGNIYSSTHLYFGNLFLEIEVLNTRILHLN